MLSTQYDFIVVDGPFGYPRYARPQIIDIVKAGMPKRFCILFDDSERIGEQDTIKVVCKILANNNTGYLIRDYVGEKNQHTIICSPDLKFLTSLR
ncbi:MAG: hypothetical protein LBV68_08225 [Spirochaetaceae bacterium]|nr:hypothetical protein [Spirochaetaceae bacterium]